MRKAVSLIVCAIVFLALASAPASSQTAKEILGKWIEA